MKTHGNIMEKQQALMNSMLIQSCHRCEHISVLFVYTTTDEEMCTPGKHVLFQKATKLDLNKLFQ